jgi:SAM-dependent methyltransferase
MPETSSAPAAASSPSRLIDMREAGDPEWRAIYDGMLGLAMTQQPAWFRPLLRKSRRLQTMTGYDHWSRAWEYPWAVGAAELPKAPRCLLDVGGGGSPFLPWFAAQGHECHIVDPSLDQGRFFAWDPQRSPWKNARTLAKQTSFRVSGIRTLWGLPKNAGKEPGLLHYWPRSADALGFPDATFDRVFCLSVIEHIPHALWPMCMREFVRVLRPGGRLVITMDMETSEANERLYRKLVEACPLRLLGNPDYPTPIDPDEAQRRHPRNWYETLGLVWSK